MLKHIVSREFNVPTLVQIAGFRIRPLTIHDVDIDYEAIMLSIDHLQKRKVFGDLSKWPSKTLTKEQDLIDLGWHQKEFQRRTSFAYIVMNEEETNYIGCIYIYPSEKADAEVYLWVTETEYKKGTDSLLFNIVKKWIDESWPFKTVVYPGRE